MAHELAHFLMDNFADRIGPSEHHGEYQMNDGKDCDPGVPYRDFLMYATTCPGSVRWTPEEIQNIRTNTDEGATYVEPF